MLYSIISFILSVIVIVIGLAFFAFPLSMIRDIRSDKYSPWNSSKREKRPKGLSKKERRRIEKAIDDAYRRMR